MPLKILSAPLRISARLLPAVRIGDGWLSWDDSTRTLWIDIPAGEFKVTDLRGPACNGGAFRDDADALESACSFLAACAESYPDGENADLFVPEVAEWAQSVSDELSMLALELSGELSA